MISRFFLESKKILMLLIYFDEYFGQEFGFVQLDNAVEYILPAVS